MFVSVVVFSLSLNSLAFGQPHFGTHARCRRACERTISLCEHSRRSHASTHIQLFLYGLYVGGSFPTACDLLNATTVSFQMQNKCDCNRFCESSADTVARKRLVSNVFDLFSCLQTDIVTKIVLELITHHHNHLNETC